MSNGSNIRCSFIGTSNFLSLLELRPCFPGSPRGRKQWLPFLSCLPLPHGVASAASLAERTRVACFLGIGTEPWIKELFSWWLCCRQLRDGASPPLRRPRCPLPHRPGRVAASSPASAPPRACSSSGAFSTLQNSFSSRAPAPLLG